MANMTIKQLDSIVVEQQSQIDSVNDLLAIWDQDGNTTKKASVDELFDSIDLNNRLDGYQEKLESGTNIKTINNESILGQGDIAITGGGMKYLYDAIEADSVISSSYYNLASQLEQFGYQPRTGIGIKSAGLGDDTSAPGEATFVSGQHTNAVGAASHAEGTASIPSRYQYHCIDLGSNTYQIPDGQTLNSNITEGTKVYFIKTGVITEVSQILDTTSFNTVDDPGIQDASIVIFYTKGALGNASHSEGIDTIASGQASHAEGSNTTASGDYSHAEGSQTIATGPYSHAEGENTTASGMSSHAEGQDTTASGLNGSHAEGYRTIASEYAAHAEGNETTASGECSHAEGAATIASGNQSHAEGDLTVAKGTASHAEGSSTTAPGDYSHAQNIGTQATTYSQTAIGTYNVIDTSGSASVRGDYAFIIGNGTSTSARSNALTVDWDGNITAGHWNNMNGSLNPSMSGSSYKRPWFNFTDPTTGDVYNFGVSFTNGQWTFDFTVKPNGDTQFHTIAGWTADY